MSTREERWATAIKEATYAGDVAYALCAGPLHEMSARYTAAFEAVMERFYRTEGLVCPECNTPTPSGRCAHCDGEVYEGAMSGPSRP
jgi:hypothetical protein